MHRCRNYRIRFIPRVRFEGRLFKKDRKERVKPIGALESLTEGSEKIISSSPKRECRARNLFSFIAWFLKYIYIYIIEKKRKRVGEGEGEGEGEREEERWGKERGVDILLKNIIIMCASKITNVCPYRISHFSEKNETLMQNRWFRWMRRWRDFSIRFLPRQLYRTTTRNLFLFGFGKGEGIAKDQTHEEIREISFLVILSYSLLKRKRSRGCGRYKNNREKVSANGFQTTLLDSSLKKDPKIAETVAHNSKDPLKWRIN